MLICTQCSSVFEVVDSDRKFYEKVSPVFNGQKFLIPEPTLCPDCRRQKRLSFRNERKWYKRNCSLCGTNIISIHHADTSFPVYCQKCWWSDKLDASEYGHDFDFSRSFFEQFRDLKLKVPRLSLTNNNSENSEYTNQAAFNKDCYYLISSSNSRNCYYGNWLQSSRDCVDCMLIEKSELCYECFNLTNCYNCLFTQTSMNCNGLAFCYDCIGCQNCLGCVGLRNKNNYILNKQVSAEEFRREWIAIFNNRESISVFQIKFTALFYSFPRKFYTGFNNEDFTGDYLRGTKNAWQCFNCRDSENIRYCTDAWQEINSQDVTETLENTNCYESQGIGWCNNALFSSQIISGNNNYYCDLIFTGNDLFGCVGLRQKSYCILNKQYSKEDYLILIPRVIANMQKDQEWGKFFPIDTSQFSYNETVAHEYFPLEEQEAVYRGWKWHHEKFEVPNVVKIIPAEKLPNVIDEIPDEILSWAIECGETRRPFIIQKGELAFYRRFGLPIPRLHPDVRHQRRMCLRNPRKLYSRVCDKKDCSIEFETTYAPDRPEKIYCEECYKKEIY